MVETVLRFKNIVYPFKNRKIIPTYENEIKTLIFSYLQTIFN
jgi:hypothetical protein